MTFLPPPPPPSTPSTSGGGGSGSGGGGRGRGGGGGATCKWGRSGSETQGQVGHLGSEMTLMQAHNY